MSRESVVFFLGLVVLVVPYVGIPPDWKLYIYTAAGVCLMVVGYMLRHSAYIRSIENEDGERDTDSFVESDGSRNEDEEDDDV